MRSNGERRTANGERRTRAGSRAVFIVFWFSVLSSPFSVPGIAAAQTTTSSTSTGFLTGFIGRASGGDIANGGLTPGGSIAVTSGSGIGAELDLAHVREFDRERFLESGITSLMVNATGVWRDATVPVRPYVVGGVGLLRARACLADCRLAVSRTDWGFDAGGGVFVLWNELIGVRGDVRYFRYLQRHTDLPLTDNGFFDFWRTSIGVTVSWPIR